jgi:hypothetical protein
MIWLVSVCIFLSLLNLILLGIVFKAIIVTNEKIEEDLVYKKQILDKLENVNVMGGIFSQQSIIIETLQKIVTLL